MNIARWLAAKGLDISGTGEYFCLSLQEEFPKTEVKPYPDWVFGIIVLLCAVPVIPIPLVALYHLIKRLTRKSPVHTYPNAYRNDGFEIETQEQYKQRA